MQLNIDMDLRMGMSLHCMQVYYLTIACQPGMGRYVLIIEHIFKSYITDPAKSLIIQQNIYMDSKMRIPLHC